MTHPEGSKILDENELAYAHTILVNNIWMGGLVAKKDIQPNMIIAQYTGHTYNSKTTIDSDYLMTGKQVATMPPGRCASTPARHGRGHGKTTCSTATERGSRCARRRA